jgi:branched-chain amino acid transport system ATP-binding protein
VTHSLSVKGLTVDYGRARALTSVAQEIPGGHITAVVGPNGAGKSSLLLAIYGSVRASGRVLLDGREIDGLSATQRARSGLTLVPQGRQIFPRLTVTENLVIMARLLGLGVELVDQALDRFPILRERSHQLAGLLSGGEQQMLAVSRALMGTPQVVLFDEMTTGLAPLIVDRLMATARQLADTGVVVLLAEPSISAIREEIDRGFVLMRGAVVGSAEGGAALEAIYRERMGVERVAAFA